MNRLAWKGRNGGIYLFAFCCGSSVLTAFVSFVEASALNRDLEHMVTEFSLWCSYFLFSFVCGVLWSNISRSRGRYEKNVHNGKIIHREKMCSYYYTSMHGTCVILLLLVGVKFGWNERDLSSVLAGYCCANPLFFNFYLLQSHTISSRTLTILCTLSPLILVFGITAKVTISPTFTDIFRDFIATITL